MRIKRRPLFADLLQKTTGLHWPGMNFFRVCCLAWLLSLATLRAQVTVEVQPDQNEFLPGEPLALAIRITNLSGRSLHLGADNDWLRFAVETREGSIIPELQKLTTQGEFTLDSSKT